MILSYIKERKGIVEPGTIEQLKDVVAQVDRKDNYLWDSACSGNLSVDGRATRFLDLTKLDERASMLCKITPEFVNEVVADKKHIKIIFEEFEKLVNINMYRWDELVYIDKFIDSASLIKVLNTVYEIPIHEASRESFTKALGNLDYTNDIVVKAAAQWFYQSLKKRQVKKGFGESLKIVSAENAKKLVNALLYNNQTDLQNIINEPKWGLGDYVYEILLDLAEKLPNDENYFVALSKAVAFYPSMAQNLVLYEPKDGSKRAFVGLTVKAYQSQGVYEALESVLNALDERAARKAVRKKSEGLYPLQIAWVDPKRGDLKIDDTIALLIKKGAGITDLLSNELIEGLINSNAFSKTAGKDFSYNKQKLADWFYWGFDSKSRAGLNIILLSTPPKDKEVFINLFLDKVSDMDKTRLVEVFKYLIINKDYLNVAEFVAKWVVANNRQAEMKSYLSGLTTTQDEKDLRAKISNDIVNYLLSDNVKPEEIVINNLWGLDLLSEKHDLGDGPGNLLTVFAKRFGGNDLMLFSLSLRQQVESLGENWINFTKAARDDFIKKGVLPLRVSLLLGFSKRNDPYFGLDVNQFGDLLKVFDINNSDHKAELDYFFSNKNLTENLPINLLTTQMLKNILASRTKDDVGNIIFKLDFAGTSPDDQNSFRDSLFEAIFDRDINFVPTDVNYSNLGKNQKKDYLFLKKITDEGNIVINDINNDFIVNGIKGNLLWKLLKMTESKNVTTSKEIKIYIQYSAEIIKGLLKISEQDWRTYVGYQEAGGKIVPVVDSVVEIMKGYLTKKKLKEILDIK